MRVFSKAVYEGVFEKAGKGVSNNAVGSLPLPGVLFLRAPLPPVPEPSRPLGLAGRGVSPGHLTCTRPRGVRGRPRALCGTGCAPGGSGAIADAEYRCGI